MIADFLLARLAEDEAELRPVLSSPHRNGKATARRRLAEVEAKRRLVELVQDAQERYDQERTSGYGDGSDLEWLTKLEALEPILNLLAQPYADHPDYLPEWCP